METPNNQASNGKNKKIRYAVVGLGWIAQEAVLPGFANAPNSELVAVVTDDEKKAAELGKRYNVRRTVVDYLRYDDLIGSGEVDAVYITLPNHQHREYTVKAARAGVHVLCEKPMAETEADCQEMIEAADQGHAKLMIAYRLHLEPANLQAIETLKSGVIGEPRFFSSVFSQSVAEGNVRLKAGLGGGPLMDMGVYCINAARYLFQDEPTQVTGLKAIKDDDPRFSEVPEAFAVLMRFRGDRLAAFTCSFGAAATDEIRVVGTKGDLRIEPAYDYHNEYTTYLTVNGKTKKKKYPRQDQFGAELAYFSNCILNDVDPQPSGREGMTDIRIISAIRSAAQAGLAVSLDLEAPPERPGVEHEMRLPPVEPPEIVHAASPGGQ
jgi:predicted dehydrogenase